MDRTKRLKTVEEFIEQAKTLRSNAEQAEASFLMFLREFELQREDLWNTAGVQTFDSFLQSSQICNVARYRNFVAGTKIIDDVHQESKTGHSSKQKSAQSTAEAIGASATIAAATFRAPTKEASVEFVSRCGKFREVHGSPPSEQTARTWVKQLDQAEPKVVRQANRMHQLEAENVTLKAEKRVLERKLASALKEVERLEKQLGKARAA